MSDATLSAARRAALGDPAERAAYLARYARVHSPADVLRERVRLGDLRADRVELAARLAHPAAREVHPRVQLVDWTSWSERREFLLPLMESDRCLVVAWLADGAERALDHAEGVLPIYESRHGDPRPRQAIEAGRDLCAVLRRWVRGEVTDGDVREARRAAASYAAASASYADDAVAASYAAASAANAAYASAAAASAAYADAAYAAYADAAAYAYAYAAGDRGLRWREARDAEHAWRRDRLALYLLGEVTPSRDPATGPPR